MKDILLIKISGEPFSINRRAYHEAGVMISVNFVMGKKIGFLNLPCNTLIKIGRNPVFLS
jgi:hypothetical protein